MMVKLIGIIISFERSYFYPKNKKEQQYIELKYFIMFLYFWYKFG